ncbi:MAG: hypothetical protein Greene07147_912 [Parcubacteria group bacterium Greene0714_7]|nr:MAG: hypothetical protein Greene041614_1065 [Parcubacteria group bacterium Greene0416_14]TSC99891.1 MAG: hypothetical protein Greene101415_1041 [Parcubacteria group bacterium Greene1014_15]TSD04789.1 MAG: hypothetical protein Greene07147_912 [Parcubacteria group bacterium Greene0714_7]
MLKRVFFVLVTLCCFGIGVSVATETQAVKHGYKILIQGTRQDGDAIAKEYSFSYTFHTRSNEFVCGPDYILVYDVYDASMFLAERMKITVRSEFDRFGIKIGGVKIYNDAGTRCQKGTLIVR